MLEQQWLNIYKETVHPLYGYASKRTGGNRELTEDIVQESYLRALGHWSSRSLPDSPLAWLKRVARNILIDYVRHRKWEAKEALGQKAETDVRSPGDEFESLEMYAAITSLGRKKARALEAFYYDGLSVKEIANEMSVSERAAEGLLRRAREALRLLLPDPHAEGGKK